MPWRMCFWSEKWPPNVKSDLTAGGVRGMLKLEAALYACAATITERRRRERATALRRPVEQNRDFVGGGVTRPRPGGPLGDSKRSARPTGPQPRSGPPPYNRGRGRRGGPILCTPAIEQNKNFVQSNGGEIGVFRIQAISGRWHQSLRTRWFMRYFARQFLFPEITAIQCHAQQLLCNRLQ